MGKNPAPPRRTAASTVSLQVFLVMTSPPSVWHRFHGRKRRVRGVEAMGPPRRGESPGTRTPLPLRGCPAERASCVEPVHRLGVSVFLPQRSLMHGAAPLLSCARAPGSPCTLPEKPCHEAGSEGQEEDFTVGSATGKQVPQHEAHGPVPGRPGLLQRRHPHHTAPQRLDGLDPVDDGEDQPTETVVASDGPIKGPVVTAKVVGRYALQTGRRGSIDSKPPAGHGPVLPHDDLPYHAGFLLVLNFP